jgi:hypothetical protein
MSRPEKQYRGFGYGWDSSAKGWRLGTRPALDSQAKSKCYAHEHDAARASDMLCNRIFREGLNARRIKLNFPPTGKLLEVAEKHEVGASKTVTWCLPAALNKAAALAKVTSTNVTKQHAARNFLKPKSAISKQRNAQDKQISGTFSDTSKGRKRVEELLSDANIKHEAASSSVAALSTILCVIVPLMVALAAASATLTGTHSNAAALLILVASISRRLRSRVLCFCDRRAAPGHWQGLLPGPAARPAGIYPWHTLSPHYHGRLDRGCTPRATAAASDLVGRQRRERPW